MATYCSESNVTDNLKGVTISGSTKITSDALASYIAEESAVIDAHISPRYTLPISDATALIFLRKICIDLVVYRVTKTLQPAQPVPVPVDGAVQEISHVTAYKEAMRMLRDIKAGKGVMPGEDIAGTEFFNSGAADRSDPAAFDFCDSDGNQDIRTDIW